MNENQLPFVTRSEGNAGVTGSGILLGGVDDVFRLSISDIGLDATSVDLVIQVSYSHRFL